MFNTMSEAYDYYDAMLDEEGPVTVAGMGFYPSEILKRMDVIAYRTGFNDYMDALEVNTDDLED